MFFTKARLCFIQVFFEDFLLKIYGSPNVLICKKHGLLCVFVLLITFRLTFDRRNLSKKYVILPRL